MLRCPGRHHTVTGVSRALSLTTAPLFLSLASSNSTWHSTFSVSATCSPRRLARQPLQKLLVRNLAHVVPEPPPPSPHIQAENINAADHLSQPFDSLTEKVNQQADEETATSRTGPAPKNISQDPAPNRPSRNPHLLHLFERLVRHGLLPQVTNKPPVRSNTYHRSSWTVIISLHELGISAQGQGSRLILAEIAAAAQFEVLLSEPDAVKKLQSYPRVEISLKNAASIIQAYCEVTLTTSQRICTVIKRLKSGAYESRKLVDDKEIGKPTISAVQDSASGINTLAVAHAIVKGDPDLWDAPTGNPFQPRIVLDAIRLENLQHFTKSLNDYLRAPPEPMIGTLKAHSDLTPPQAGSDCDTEQAQALNTESPGQRVIPELDSWLAGLPFSPPIAKMLILGAATKCLEPAILLAALEKHAVYRKMEERSEKEDYHRNNKFVKGDHEGLVSLFKIVRDIGRISKTLEDNSNPDHELARRELEKSQKQAQQNLKYSRGFDHFDPKGIASVSATAGDVERALSTASLAEYCENFSYKEVPGSELRIRAEPYGGSLNRNSSNMAMMRHLLVLGFPDSLARIGYSTLIPGQPPQLHINSHQVFIDSPFKAPQTTKHLRMILKTSPFVVVTGATENPENSGPAARYCTPITTWQAVLLGKDLSLPDRSGSLVKGPVQVIINNWIPVLVKSEVAGVSDEQAREALFEARKALHRAIDKAMFYYIKFSWHSFDFCTLMLDLLPNEDGFEARKRRIVAANRAEFRRPPRTTASRMEPTVST